MLNNKDLEIITQLRKNARESLTRMSKKTSIPVSTIYDRLKVHENSLIKKFTSLIDFNELGFMTRVYIAIKVGSDKKDILKEHLSKHPNINSFFRINNDYDFLVEGIFKNIKQLQEFMDNLEKRFNVETKIFYIVEDIKREAFLTDKTVFMLADHN